MNRSKDCVISPWQGLKFKSLFMLKRVCRFVTCQCDVEAKFTNEK